MRAEEVRIGNIVSSRYLSEYEIESGDITDLYYDFNRFNPIPITEEWLLKLGFKQWGSYKHLWKVKGCQVCTVNSSLNSGFYLNENYRVTIQFVHQLQNLYFALTGEELTIK